MATPIQFSLIAPENFAGSINKAIPQSWQAYVSDSEIQNMGLVTSPTLLEWDAYKSIAEGTPIYPTVAAPLKSTNKGVTTCTINFALVLPGIKNDVKKTPLCLMCVNKLISVSDKGSSYQNVIGIDIGYETKQEVEYTFAKSNNITEYIFTIEFSTTDIVDQIYCQYDDTVPFFPNTNSPIIKSIENNTSGEGPELDKNMVTTPRGTVVSVSIGNP